MDARYDYVKQSRQMIADSDLPSSLKSAMEVELLRLSVLLLKEEPWNRRTHGPGPAAFSRISEKVRSLCLEGGQSEIPGELLEELKQLVAAVSNALPSDG